MLEAEGKKTGTGSTTWTKTGLERILSNIKYSGDVIQGLSTTVDVMNKKRVKNNGEAPQYFIENGMPAIIDKQTYLLAKGELARRQRMFIEGVGNKDSYGPAVYSGKYPLTRKIICPLCSQYYNHRNARGTDVWECYGRIHSECGAEILKEEELQAAILEAMQELWESQPKIKMNRVPELTKDDSEDKFLEAAKLYAENIFAKRTQEFLKGDKPETYDPGLASSLIDRIVPSDDAYLVTFYGVSPVNIARTNGKHTIIGRRLKRS